MAVFDPDNLHLTDFMDLATLQEIQDSFAAVAEVKATITDAQGNVLTQPTPTRAFLRRQRVLAETAAGGGDEGLSASGLTASPPPPAQDQPQRDGAEYVAPIIVNDQRLGTIRMAANGTLVNIDEAKLTNLGEKYGLDFKQIRSIASQLTRARNTRPAAIQFLFLLANAIARLCFQEFQLRQRINELTVVYNLTMLLSEARDLPAVLKRTVQLVSEVMGTKAASIRLIDEQRDELVIKAVHNLSNEYLAKGPVRLSKADIDLAALGERGYEYVRNIPSD